MAKKTIVDEMLRKAEAIKGIAILIEDELKSFDEDASIKEAGQRREKISNLILYAKQIRYCGKEYSRIADLEIKYEDELSKFRKLFN